MTPALSLPAARQSGELDGAERVRASVEQRIAEMRLHVRDREQRIAADESNLEWSRGQLAIERAELEFLGRCLAWIDAAAALPKAPCTLCQGEGCTYGCGAVPAD